jgi:Zn-finger nucleic acid-binding protein
MKCISCESEINPKFKYAIEQNVCPFCGDNIMEELLKTLLVSLRDTMEKMRQYPQQLDDWLLSNYSYIKTDSPDLVNYVSKDTIKEVMRNVNDEEFERKKKLIKVKTDRGEEEVVIEKIQPDSKTAEFFERAEVIKRGIKNDEEDIGGDGDLDTGDEAGSESDGVELNPVKPIKSKVFKNVAERTEYFKELKKKIETEAQKPKGFANKEDLVNMMEGDNIEAVDPEDVSAFQAALSDGNVITSSLTQSLNNEDAMTEYILAANLAASKGKNKGQEQDIRAWQRMQSRVVNARRAFETGENRGKNGFSRSQG